MRLDISINCSSPAFQPDPVAELGRILEQLAKFYREYGQVDDKTLFDSSGQPVGRARMFGKINEVDHARTVS